MRVFLYFSPIPYKPFIIEELLSAMNKIHTYIYSKTPVKLQFLSLSFTEVGKQNSMLSIVQNLNICKKSSICMEAEF